jgi:hypothetical protein
VMFSSSICSEESGGFKDFLKHSQSRNRN